MDFPPAIPAPVAAVIAGAVILSLFVYAALLRRIFSRGGKVRVDGFGPPDAGLALMFLVWFATVAIKGFAAEPRPVQSADLAQSAIIFLVIVFAIASFLSFRGIKIGEQFGLRRVGFLAVPILAFALLLAALPVVGGAGALMQKMLGPEAKQQEIVRFFLEASKNSDHKIVVETLFLGAVLAPMAEEFIFRGYLYGVLKRYFGIAAGILLNAALFAAIHANLASLPSLFLLAVCFTIAYETTGSILVSMSMHAMFNLMMFAAMLQSSQAGQ